MTWSSHFVHMLFVLVHLHYSSFSLFQWTHKDENLTWKPPLSFFFLSICFFIVTSLCHFCDNFMLCYLGYNSYLGRVNYICGIYVHETHKSLRAMITPHLKFWINVYYCKGLIGVVVVVGRCSSCVGGKVMLT